MGRIESVRKSVHPGGKAPGAASKEREALVAFHDLCERPTAVARALRYDFACCPDMMSLRHHRCRWVKFLQAGFGSVICTSTFLSSILTG